ncbi:MAG: hypothetical protein Q9159_001193 [Coniocarpon cinnabarinum]
MVFNSLCRLLALLAAIVLVTASPLNGKPTDLIKPYKRAPLQDIVTWDEHSLYVYGERIFFYSGEYHPYRLPVPGQWLDVFQKIRALGYSGVSFYVDWSLLEGTEGTFRSEGIFDLVPFFEAATQAGIYLLARPGPYINAEVSGGGFPGWLSRVDALLRTNQTNYIDATQNYVSSVSGIIADAQITNGGPVILLQPENEYDGATDGVLFPDYDYFQTVEDQYRNAGIVVPLISNDNAPKGLFAPGTPAAVDIYGHDSYPQGFNCRSPYTWNDGALPTNFRTLHEEQSPTTPYSLIEFQGGSFDPWGGYGFNSCAILLNDQFERVFYKNNLAFGVTIFNIYMTYGGTNWGNIGYPQGYTSYDYGAVIMEDRTVNREKYSEAKLIANFAQASPAYLTATPGNTTNGSYTDNPTLAVTPLFGNGTDTNFYVVRHAAYNSEDSTNYSLTLGGNLTVPQLGGQLTLPGRDSKIHVQNYNVGQYDLAYSTAEVFTWKNSSAGSVLIVYGGPGEQHELAVAGNPEFSQVAGGTVTQETRGNATVVNWQTSPDPYIVQFDGLALTAYLVDRNTAYNHWVFNDTIVQAGYLVRNATFSAAGQLDIAGDLNASVPVSVLAPTDKNIAKLTFNGEDVATTTNPTTGAVSGNLTYTAPEVSLPDFSTAGWKFIDSLPEIQASYDDSAWPVANLTSSPNIQFNNFTTPVSLYGGDYGFSYGSLVFRGHFTASGAETSFSVNAQGGIAFASATWLNDTFLGAWPGDNTNANYTTTFPLSNLTSGSNYVLTIVIDLTGLDENYDAGDSGLKSPRGILDYTLGGREKSDVSWKLTGNLGGENYADLTRGPLNEDGYYAVRQGYHLPGAPLDAFNDSSPYDGLSAPGVGFYGVNFDLDLPKGYDIPLSFSFTNNTSASRTNLYVNGYQFGKYVSNVGPQQLFPVPEGILNHQGSNYVAVTLFNMDAQGANLDGFSLVNTATVQSGYGDVVAAPQTGFSPRAGAY